MLSKFLVPIFAVVAACGTHQARMSSVKGETAYDKAKPALDKFCVPCHKTERPAAKLALDKYPFVSATISDQAVIATKIKARIHDETKPMPPKIVVDRPTADDLALMDALAD